MGDYTDNKKPLGANVKRLVAYKASMDAIPNGGGFKSGIEFLLDSERMAQTFRDAVAWVEQALAVFKAAPDNPYGDDDEAIAASILNKIDGKRYGKQ